VTRQTKDDGRRTVAATVIKGSSDLPAEHSGQAGVVTFSGWEDANCVLAGFTVTGTGKGNLVTFILRSSGLRSRHYGGEGTTENGRPS
jgi:hypothetical protein